MSRIGRLPIAVPEGVTMHVVDGTVRVEGPRGTLARTLPPGIRVEVTGRSAVVKPEGDARALRSLHGFTRVLEINGVGYRAELRGNVLWLTLGYSHPIAYQLPPGVTAKVDRQVVITLESADRELLGQVAAQLRALRAPEPYKGKGVKYAGEAIRRKAGKAAAGATR